MGADLPWSRKWIGHKTIKLTLTRALHDQFWDDYQHLASCLDTPETYLFLKFFKNLFNWRLITLQHYSGFCHTLTWISHGFTCVPHHEPLSQLPSHPIPLGHPSSLALSTMSHASNLDWRSVSYIRFNAILSNYPTAILSHRVQKSVLCICISFSVSHTGSLLPSFKFHIYIC